MTQNVSVQFKLFLWLLAAIFAGAATLLAIFLTSAATSTGSSPALAIAMTPGTNTGVLAPGELRWFRLLPEAHGDQFQERSLSMFYTAAGEAPARNVNFELYTAAEVLAWQQGHHESPVNFGAGMAVSRDGAAQTGERLWRGTLVRDNAYYLLLCNESDRPVDYWLADADLAAPPFNDELMAATQPASSLPSPPPPGVTPHSAIPLTTERSHGTLLPGQEAWYSLAIDQDAQAQFEPAALTMVMTPNDTNSIHAVTLDLFAQAGIRDWSPQSRNSVQNIGAGGVVVRDDNPWTGERVWDGWLVSQELYYVRVSNGASIPVDYWLFNGDVYQPSLE